MNPFFVAIFLKEIFEKSLNLELLSFTSILNRRNLKGGMLIVLKIKENSYSEKNATYTKF
jgi:hypothetical protein